MIRLENVAYFYEEQKVLDDLCFEIKHKERIVLLGNNGCGKSTLLKLLAGLIRPQRGSYFFQGQKVDKKFLKQNGKVFRKEVAILFQTPDTMLFNPTVYDEIAFSLEEFGVVGNVEQIAKEFGITHLLQKSPLKLSGGEKQKVAFAAIFAVQPQLLLLDEPTANLDPKSTGWMIDFLLEQDITTVIATHNLSLAYELGERAIAMNENHQIIFDGAIEELFSNEELLLEANLIHKHKHKHKGIEHSHFHIHDWS